MATTYPNQIDDNTSVPQIIDLKTPVNADSVNTLRGAVLAIEAELGIDPSREYGTVRARLDALSALIGSGGGGGGGYVYDFRGYGGINIVDNAPIVYFDGYDLLPRDGSRSMTGDLDLDGYDILNASLIDSDGIIFSESFSNPTTPEVGKATLWYRASDGYLVYTDTDKEIVLSGCPLIDGYERIYGVSGDQTTSETSGYQTIGALTLNSEDYDIGSFIFQAIIETTDSGIDAEIRIFNATTGSEMPETVTSSNSTVPESIETEFNPNVGENLYLIQLKASAVGTASDFVSCKNAVILAAINKPTGSGSSGTNFQEVIGGIATTNDTPTVVATIPISDASCKSIDAMISARDTATGNSGGWTISGTFESTGGVVSQIGYTSILKSEKEYNGFAVTFSVGSGVIYILVTGHPYNNTNWRAIAHIVEVP